MSTQAIDLTGRTVLRLTGGDRQRYLNGQVSNDVCKLTAENSLAACVTTIKGKLDALVYLTEIDDSYLIDTEPELREPLGVRLDKYIIADDCELNDVSEDWHLLHVLGQVDSPHPSRACKRFGQPGTDLWLPAGEPLPDGLEFLTAAATESLRIRNGVPRWGAELSSDTLPAEARLDETAVDFHKGCYIGQEVISRIKSVGRVNRKLVRLRTTAGPPPAGLEPGQRLFDGEIEVGTLTSASGSDALAFVKRDHQLAGTLLSLAAPAGTGKKNLSTTLEIVEGLPV